METKLCALVWGKEEKEWKEPQQLIMVLDLKKLKFLFFAFFLVHIWLNSWLAVFQALVFHQTPPLKIWRTVKYFLHSKRANSYSGHLTGQRPKHAYRRCRCHLSYDRSFSLRSLTQRSKCMTAWDARFLQVCYKRYAAKFPKSATLNCVWISIGCRLKVIYSLHGNLCIICDNGSN